MYIWLFCHVCSACSQHTTILYVSIYCCGNGGKLSRRRKKNTPFQFMFMPLFFGILESYKMFDAISNTNRINNFVISIMTSIYINYSIYNLVVVAIRCLILCWVKYLTVPKISSRNAHRMHLKLVIKRAISYGKSTMSLMS